jgi:hypothetical protein
MKARSAGQPWLYCEQGTHDEVTRTKKSTALRPTPASLTSTILRTGLRQPATWRCDRRPSLADVAASTTPVLE